MILTRYEMYLTMEKNASENTLKSYVRDLRQLQQFLKTQGVANMETATTKTLQHYVDDLGSAGKSKASIARFVSASKGFYEYVKTLGQRRDNPVTGIQIAPLEAKPPQVLSPEQVEQLLQAPQTVDAKGDRDSSMLSLLYATGMRVGELLALDIMDVDLFGGCIRCGRGGKERVLPLYPEAVASLSHYISSSRPMIITDVDEQALFVNMNGQRMSRQGFWKLLKQYQVQAGIETDLTPHTLRHSFAAHLLAHGAQIGAVQKMLGHANRSTTRAYSQLMSQQVRDEYLKNHPKA